MLGRTIDVYGRINESGSFMTPRLIANVIATKTGRIIQIFPVEHIYNNNNNNNNNNKNNNNKYLFYSEDKSQVIKNNIVIYQDENLTKKIIAIADY